MRSVVALLIAASGVLGSRTIDAKGARPMSYGQMVRQWHAVSRDDSGRETADGRPLLVLEMINTGERAELTPLRDDGGFAAAELERADEALRDQKTGERASMDPRLIDLIYRLERHFNAPLIRVISGYRSPHGKHSNHSKGRALDLVVPGVKDADVARYARTMGFVGVGVYPVSGFVHIDSRAQSYFWVDASSPGRRSRIVHVYAKLGAEADAKALARGEAPPGDESMPPGNEGSGESATFTSTAPAALRDTANR